MEKVSGFIKGKPKS